MGELDDKWHRNFRASERRKSLKVRAVEHMGGKCRICGYDNPVALQFHHCDPRLKDFAISNRMSWAAIEAELKKCVMLCANCHIETHAGEHPEYLVSEDEPLFDDWEGDFDREGLLESIE